MPPPGSHRLRLASLLALSSSCDFGAATPADNVALHVVASDPAPVDGGAARHPANAPIRVTFDRLLGPSSVNRATVTMTSGTLGVYGGVQYDPARREISFTPADVRPGLQYVFTVLPTVRGWDGAALARPYTVVFVAAPRVTLPAPQPPRFRAEVAPLLARRCARPGCHAPPDAAMGMDLSTPEAIRRYTVGVAARQRPRGAPTGLDPRWGPMLRIDPGLGDGLGAPAASYLVYKLLGGGPALGQRMPPDGPALTPDELDRITRWIAAGARDDATPTP